MTRRKRKRLPRSEARRARSSPPSQEVVSSGSNPARPGTARHAIYEALFNGGTVKELRDYAIEVFQRSEPSTEALAHMMVQYTSEAEFRRNCKRLEELGFDVRIKKREGVTHIKVS